MRSMRPPVAALSRLGIGRLDALNLRRMMETSGSRSVLDHARRCMDAPGDVEYIRDRNDVYARAGIEYVNTGETYTPTLLYDRKLGRYYVRSWGDHVEQQERRGRLFA
jgi:hypothetical protein